jgi:hypothetical protein
MFTLIFFFALQFDMQIDVYAKEGSVLANLHHTKIKRKSYWLLRDFFSMNFFGNSLDFEGLVNYDPFRCLHDLI